MTTCNDIYKCVTEGIHDILALRDIREKKSDGSFVTKGDLLCQDMISQCVESLNTPMEIISEEKNLGNFVYDENKNYIVIDPIDGTENFTSGLKEWGVSVSVYKKGRHHESMLFIPELGLRVITGDKIYSHFSRIHGLSSSHGPSRFASLSDDVEYRITGCCVYSLYNVITGSFVSFGNNIGAHSWDILAGLNIALEHNLNVTVNDKKYGGEFLNPNEKYRFRVQR